MFDGDLVFALSLGQKRADLNVLGTAAAEVTAQAIVRGVLTAKGLGGVPAAQELARRSQKSEVRSQKGERPTLSI
jgi:L-aminopeptidase/D-esterase-like protein